jgi:MFS family permease
METTAGATNIAQPSSQPQPNLDDRPPSTFAALRHRNFRLWFVGQMLSQMGSWMQSVAQGWLVYQLTGSELALGTIMFLGSLPTLFLMLPAGALADRLPKRTVVVAAQTMMMLQALALAALAFARVLQVWHVGVLAFTLGIANSFDAPARQAMVVEMVDDRRDMMNAIALNSTMFNVARVVGPAIAGIMLAGMGAAWCFALNGLSFGAVIAALLAMRLVEVRRPEQTESITLQVKAGLSYILKNPAIRSMMSLVAVAQLFGYWYGVLLPAYAAAVLRVGETGLGTLNAATGVGAVLGSLLVASFAHSRRRVNLLTLGSFLFPASVLLLALSRSLVFSMLCLAAAGVGFVNQGATANTLIQAAVPDALRGRVMAVYLLMFFGTTPFAALMAGSFGQVFGVRAAVVVGAGITLVFTMIVYARVPALRRAEG